MSQEQRGTPRKEKYEFVNRESLLSKWKCERCSEVPVHPVKTPCSRKLCGNCKDELFEEGKRLKECPVCHGRGIGSPHKKSPCKGQGLAKSQLVPDKALNRKLGEELVFCINKKYGCTATRPLNYLEKHRNSCEFTDCELCGQTYHRQAKEEHEDECEEMEAICDSCGTQFSTKGNLKYHKGIREECMPDGTPVCVLCEPPRRTKVGTNEAGAGSETSSQQVIPVKIYKSKEKLLGHLKTGIPVDKHIESLFIRVEEFEEKIRLHNDQLWKDLREFIAKKSKPLQEEIAKTDADLRNVTAKRDELSARVDDFQERIKNTIGQVQYYDLLKSVEQLEENVKVDSGNYEQIVEHYDRTLDRLTEVNNVLEKRVKDLEKARFNGELVWRIRDYKKLRAKAKRDNEYMTSHAFYTSMQGYKLCCRLYLNGEGGNRGRSLSIYLVIMKGDYDDVLEWPLKNRAITFKLFCPKDQTRNEVCTLMSDEFSDSFHKPIDDMNTPYGISNFFELEDLDDPSKGYEVDDSIYVGITMKRR